MAILHHYTLDPFSRRIRLALAELGLSADLIEEKPGPARPELLALNPSGSVPVLFEDDGAVLCGAYAITEYLDEVHGGARALLGSTVETRAEVRRLVSWFDEKFHHDVTLAIVGEKVIGRFLPPELCSFDGAGASGGSAGPRGTRSG